MKKAVRLFSNVRHDRRRPLGRRASSASLNPTPNLGRKGRRELIVLLGVSHFCLCWDWKKID